MNRIVPFISKASCALFTSLMNTCCTEQGLLLELKGICHPVPSSDAVTDDCMLLVTIHVLSDDWLVFAD